MPNCIIGERKEAFEKFEHLIYHQLSHNKYLQLVEANELYLCITKFENYFYNHAEQQKIEDMIWALLNKRIIIINGFIIDPTNINNKNEAFLITIYPMELLFSPWADCHSWHSKKYPKTIYISG